MFDYRYQIPILQITRDIGKQGERILNSDEILFYRTDLPSAIKVALQDVCNGLIEFNPLIKDITLSYLISTEGCTSQVMHCDNTSISLFRTLSKEQLHPLRHPSVNEMPFSMLIALENHKINPTKIEFYHGLEKQIVTIVQGRGVIFRGDKEHGGAAYTQRNIRLFLGVGTYKFPYNPKEVDIIVDTEIE